MGGEQAAGVMTLLAEEQARSRGQQPDSAALEAQEQALRQRFESESSALYASARLWDDGILDPRDTRQALVMALRTVHNQDFVREGAPRYGVFRM